MTISDAELARIRERQLRPLTIQDRAEMVDPEERAEIERQAIDAFVDDLAAALERESQRARALDREPSWRLTPIAFVREVGLTWTGTRK